MLLFPSHRAMTEGSTEVTYGLSSPFPSSLYCQHSVADLRLTMYTTKKASRNLHSLLIFPR